MKKIFLVCLVLSACASPTPYSLNMKSLLEDGENKKICVVTTDKTIEATTYKMFFADWLTNNKFKVIDPSTKKCDYLFGFTSGMKSYSYTKRVADWGVTGIRSIDTYSNSNTNGYLSGYSNYAGYGNYNHTGWLNANTSTHSTSNVNYNYGITGYHNEEDTIYITKFYCFILNLKNKDVVFESTVAIDWPMKQDEFSQVVMDIYSKTPMQNISSKIICDENGCNPI